MQKGDERAQGVGGAGTWVRVWGGEFNCFYHCVCSLHPLKSKK